jgi:aminoglycoside phosphotransferase (APT) family kinase protein
VAVIAQPNSGRLPSQLLADILSRTAPDLEFAESEVLYRDEHSNDFAEIRAPDGRSLIVKRARYEWAGPRFATSRIASALIRARTDCEAPAPLPMPLDAAGRPLEVYWKLDLPTLEEIWPGLDVDQRDEALRSWGGLTARLHGVRLEGFGPLSDPRTRGRSLARYLHEELRDRLLPAMSGVWVEAQTIVERLIELVPQVEARAGGVSRLVHNDLHMGNVLCAQVGRGVSCVGLIDLETSVAAPPEADLAAIGVHHGTVLSQRIEGEWMARVHAGYGKPLDDLVLKFFRCLHLVNMGFYSAMIGHDWHAAQVRQAAADELDELSPHHPVIGIRT